MHLIFKDAGKHLNLAENKTVKNTNPIHVAKFSRDTCIIKFLHFLRHRWRIILFLEFETFVIYVHSERWKLCKSQLRRSAGLLA